MDEQISRYSVSKKETTPKRDQMVYDDSLSLSSTPPILEDSHNEKVEKSESISEHFTSNSDSVENDRSYQEIEITNRPTVFGFPVLDGQLGQNFQETPYISDSSAPSDNSIISLNYLKNLEQGDELHSILDEILQNDQLRSHNEDTISNSMGESLNIFTNLDLDDKCLSNVRYHNDISVEEKNVYASNFSPVQNESVLEKRIKDFEELIAIKDSTIAVLTSELDSLRDMSNTNTVSTLSTTEYKQLQEEYHTKLLECNGVIVYKNDLIQQLIESLNQSVSGRKELLVQIDRFKNEIIELQKQLQDTTNAVEMHQCEPPEKSTYEVDSSESSRDIEIHKKKSNQWLRCDNEKKDLKEEVDRLKDLLANIEGGSTELINLKNELEAKHAIEMEELRTYFEKKCVDLEKNYSEEIFSQQSRKLSDSTCSEAELNTDPVFLRLPGPGGDIQSDLQPHFTKKDIFNLQNELNSLVTKIGRYNLDSVTDDDLQNLLSEIGKSNLNDLLKYDLSAIRCDLQNKYHAELVILRDNNEKKLDELTVQYEDKLRDSEERYLEEIESLRMRLDEVTKQISVCSAVQEVRLATSETGCEEWPSEFLTLRDKFVHKYEADIEILEKEHQDEINKLREELSKMLNGVVERNSMRDADGLNKGELEILRERDGLKKQVSSLRNLFGELVKYFTLCEDELNNTLVDELLKQGFDKNFSPIEDELNLTNSSPTRSNFPGDAVTRVHLTPNFIGLINLIESSSQENCDSKDISVDLKSELGFCLEKLKSDANAILALSSNIPKQEIADPSRNSSVEEKLTYLTRQLITESQMRKKIEEELENVSRYVVSLEMEKNRLEAQLDQVIAKENLLEMDLTQAKTEITRFIGNEPKVIVTEGYGEEGAEVETWGDTLTILVNLQEKARSMLSRSRARANPSLLQLIEELCSVGERIKTESRRENLDLQQQIEAADKKYRTTQKFLEDQAVEREQERDEAQKKIEILYRQLRERDRDKDNCKRAVAEVEQLEHQLQEMTRLLACQTETCKSVESERDEAVEKIKVLRDIIRELEVQTESNSNEIEKQLKAVNELQCMLNQQDRSNVDTGLDDLSKDVSDVTQLYQHVDHLENELQRLRVHSELAGSEGALKQIRSQLFEIELLLDMKTKELEALNCTTVTNCSSPSEDISARDLVLPMSPMKMDDSDIPLQQLARLKEKLLRHSRAEDAAVKRIKDLEMQVFSLRQEVEENSSEKDYLKKQIQEQLVLISDFQIRLDEQRIRAEHIEKQTNTSLELKIYDLQAEVASLCEKLQQKEKAIQHQQALLEATNNRMRLLENELGSVKEDEVVVEMQKELEGLRSKNEQLEIKMNKDARMVPNLVENIILDKNVDIGKLRSKLDDTEKLLEAYTSLNLDWNELLTISNMKNSGTKLEELLSIIELSQVDQMRRVESGNDSDHLGLSPNIMLKNRKVDVTALEQEFSVINCPSFAKSEIHARNSMEASHKRVHFEDMQVESLKKEIIALKDEIANKDTVVEEYKEQLLLLNGLEMKIEKLQLSLEKTEEALSTATESFEREQLELRNREKDLGVELAEKKLRLSEMEKCIELLEKEVQRKEEMYLDLARAKKDLEEQVSVHKHDSFVRLDTVIREKNNEIDELKNKLKVVDEMRSLKRQLGDKNFEATSLRAENDKLSQQLQQLEINRETLEVRLKMVVNDNIKLKKEIDNNKMEISSITTEMNLVKEKLSKKRKMMRELENIVETKELAINDLEQETASQKVVLEDREQKIEIVEQDAKQYHRNIALLKEEIEELKKSDKCKLTEEINKLNKERAHMMELMDEKEKIINQMAGDSHQLHVNLVTIKSKLKEPGNIIDLGNKLKEEQKRSAELVQEIHDLKMRLMRYNNDMANSVDEITDQLKRELDNSEEIDSNIITAVSDQSQNTVSDSQDIEVYKKFLSFEKASNQQLSKQIDDLHKRIVELRQQLQKERETLLQTQTDDTKLIEQLTIQLDVVLDREETLRSILNEKEIEHDVLEREINSLKRKQATSSESTDYRQPPSKEVLEASRLRKDLETAQAEKDKLSVELDSARQAKLEIDAAFKYTKDLLGFEVQKSKNLQDKIRKLLNTEKQLKESIKQKELVAEQLKDELQKERPNPNKEKSELVEKFHTNEIQQNVFTNSVSDSLLHKIEELNNALSDNRRLMEIIQKLTNEKNRIEKELSISKNTFKNNLQFSDLVTRNDFLFAKTLKLESTKKALVWQKRYLTEHLQAYHQQCLKQALPNAFLIIKEFRLHQTPKQHFRSTAWLIISIIRMRYLVRRWHSGIRIAETLNGRHYRASVDENQEPILSTRFQVGQPVSSQFFANLPEGNTVNHLRRDAEESFPNVGNHERIPRFEESGVDIAWSGRTPPSRENISRIYIGSTTVLNEDLTLLKAPQLLAKFVDRFDQIQERLGVTSGNNFPQDNC